MIEFERLNDDVVLTKPCEAPNLVWKTITKVTKPNFPVIINATKTGILPQNTLIYCK